MKVYVLLWVCGTAFTLAGAIGSSAPFRNLNFEAPQDLGPPDIEGKVPVQEAFPGWEVWAGDKPLQAVYYNGWTLDLAAVSLLDSQGEYLPDPFEGHYMAYLIAGLVEIDVPFGFAAGPASLTQTGLVPLGTRSVRFRASGAPLQVWLGGERVPIVLIEDHTDYVVYGGDAARFAGREVELRISAPADPTGWMPFRTQGFLDAIEFSPEPVPEPGVAALAAFFLLGWLLKKRRRVARGCRFVLSVVLLGWSVATGSAAGFRNLNFEEAVGPFKLENPIDRALPGWELWAGENRLESVLFDSISLAQASGSLIDAWLPAGPRPFEGAYMAFLFSGLVRSGESGESIPGSASLVQSGLVPAGSQSLRLKAFGDAFQVRLGGTAIKMIPLAHTSDYVLYVGDVSAFAGQVMELEISTLPSKGGHYAFRNKLFLDAIEFSPEPIAEPGVIRLLVWGAFMLMWGGARRFRTE